MLGDSRELIGTIGGHTAETMIMLATIDPKRYRPRHYYLSEGDTLSTRKASELEETFKGVRFLLPLECTFGLINSI